MYLQEILEGTIGLAFVYLLLSLVCMQVQEWLANAFRWRADNLEGGLRELLADDALSEGWRRILRKMPFLKQILKVLGRWPIPVVSNVPSKSLQIATRTGSWKVCRFSVEYIANQRPLPVFSKGWGNITNKLRIG